MSKEPVAVVGVGQTKHVAARRDVSIAGLVREAARRALDDAELTWADIEAVVIGKAPDFFEGVMMPELYLADALGAVGKPMMRVHTAGSVGGSTALVAASLVAARVHGTVLTLAFEKQSESNAMWGLSLPIPFQQPLLAGCRRLLRPARAGVHAAQRRPRHGRFPGGVQEPPQRAEEPVRPSPRARHHAGEGPGLTHAVGPDPLLGDLPVLRRGRRDGPHRPGGGRPVAPARRVDARRRHAQRADALRGEGQCVAARGTGLRGGRVPAGGHRGSAPGDRRGGDVRAVLLVRADVAGEPGFAAEGEGWKLTESGVTELDGDLPVDMSGGVLSTNPIGASGMIRFAEAALQVRGLAGEHQVEGARRVLGHAYGGGSQFFSMWLVGAEPPTS